MVETLVNALQQTTLIEALAVVFSIAYVVLAAYENNWCWLAAGISTTLYIYICFSAKLYSETGLQVFYLVMAFYGWWQWTKNSKTQKSNIEALDAIEQTKKISIISLAPKKHILFIITAAVLSFPFYFITKNYTDAAMPLSDALVTTFSVVATFMVANKIIENWLWWIAIDSLAVYIYISRSLHLTAVLYFIYVIIAVVGFVNWKKEFSRQQA